MRLVTFVQAPDSPSIDGPRKAAKVSKALHAKNGSKHDVLRLSGTDSEGNSFKVDLKSIDWKALQVSYKRASTRIQRQAGLVSS